MNTYYKRLDERKLERKLKAEGGVVIEGPRFCGKSTLALQLAKSGVRLDGSPELRALAEADPNEILAGETPRLVDEWQLAPNVWNAVRHEIDKRRDVGQFILTGSATPADSVIRHTGAGRIGRIRMRTMSLYESKKSAERVDFNEFFDNDAQTGISGYDGLSVREYCEEIVRGGWPSLVNADIPESIEAVDDYVDNISRLNVSDDDEIESNSTRMKDLLTSISRNLATEATIKKVTAEAQIASVNTSKKYLDELSNIFILEQLPAWRPHIRSTIRSKVAPKWHFVDPSIAVSQLSLSPDLLLQDLQATGFFFESLVVRDLRIYASALGGEVSYYKDSTGLEIDAIVQLRNGLWAAFEVKMGGDLNIQKGIDNLLKLKNRLSEYELKNMMSLNIVTAGNVSSHNKDADVNIVSLGHLFV